MQSHRATTHVLAVELLIGLLHSEVAGGQIHVQDFSVVPVWHKKFSFQIQYAPIYKVSNRIAGYPPPTTVYIANWSPSRRMCISSGSCSSLSATTTRRLMPNWASKSPTVAPSSRSTVPRPLASGGSLSRSIPCKCTLTFNQSPPLRFRSIKSYCHKIQSSCPCHPTIKQGTCLPQSRSPHPQPRSAGRQRHLCESEPRSPHRSWARHCHRWRHG